MEMNTYQKKSSETVLDTIKDNPSYFALGLCGEAGELAEHVKKSIRDGNEIDKDAIKKEAGDLMWYCSQLCEYYGITLNEVAHANIKKLTSRQKRSKLTGSGDER